MSGPTFWFKTFPVAGIIVCIVLLIVIKKVLGKPGPGSNQNFFAVVVLALLVGACAVAAWGFKNVKPPKMEGTWK